MGKRITGIMELIVCSISEQIKKCLEIRNQVFVKEQGVDNNIEVDDIDKNGNAMYFLCELEGEYVGTCRIVDLGLGVAKLQRFAILKSYRNKGTGIIFLTKLIDYLESCHYNKITLNAQLHSIPFYEKTGFRVVSDSFEEAGIIHKKMEYRY